MAGKHEGWLMREAVALVSLEGPMPLVELLTEIAVRDRKLACFMDEQTVRVGGDLSWLMVWCPEEEQVRDT